MELLGRTLSSAFQNAWGQMWGRPRFWLIFGLLTTAGAAFSLLVPQSFGRDTMVPGPDLAMIVVFSLILTVMQYFVIADAIRTVVPAFRFTIGLFFLGILVSAALGTIVEFGLYLLIVPGIYVGVRLSQWYLYTLFREQSPLSQSWRDTEGVFWATVLLNLALWCVLEFGITFIVGIGVAFVVLWEPLMLIFAPLCLIALGYLLTISWLGWVHWADALRRRPQLTPAVRGVAEG